MDMVADGKSLEHNSSVRPAVSTAGLTQFSIKPSLILYYKIHLNFNKSPPIFLFTGLSYQKS